MIMKNSTARLIAIAIAFLILPNGFSQDTMLCMGGHWSEDEANLMMKGFASEWKDLTTVLRMMNYRLFAENPNLLGQLIAMQQANPFQ